MSKKTTRREWAWRRWRTLPASERRLVPALFVLLPAVAAGIRVFGVRRVCGFLSRDASGTGRDASMTGEDAYPTRIGRLVDAVARRLPGHPACLTRSVTLWHLLRRRGLPAELRLGVRTVDAQLEAHAWVELDGQVVNDSQDVGQRFAAFEELKLDSRPQ